MQSATQLSPWGYMTQKQGRDRAFELGRHMDIHTTDKDKLLYALREADVKRVITASSTMLNVFLPVRSILPIIVETLRQSHLSINMENVFWTVADIHAIRRDDRRRAV